jgi:hypothetical protein
MAAPLSFILPSRFPGPSAPSGDCHPLLITAPTPAELITYALSFVQSQSRDGRVVLITSQTRESFQQSVRLSDSITSLSSPLCSTTSILASRKITAYFVETLAHLRVLLSHLQHMEISFLGIDSLIAVHESAQELSAQGISRTMAAIVDIVATNGVLLIREPTSSVDRSVPILHAGIEGGLNQSSISITRILGRWIRGFWTQHSTDETQCTAEWTCKGTRERISWTAYNGEIDNVHISRIELLG